MFILKLEQNLFAECNPKKIASAKEDRQGDSIFRSLEVDFCENIKTMIVEKRKYSYFFKHYLYWDENLTEPVDFKEEKAKKFLLAFYKKYCPDYLKDSAVEYEEGKELADYFQTAKIPGDSMQHFVPGEGAVADEELERKKNQPAYVALDGYHIFDKEEKQHIDSQLDALKDQFADQLKELEGLMNLQKGKE